MTQYENFTVTEINFIEPAGNDLGNLGTQTLSIIPDTGYTLDVNDFGLVAPIPPEVDQNSFVFTQNGDRVDVSFSFISGYIMPSNPIEVPLCFLGFANPAGYSIAGSVDIATTNATPLPQLVPYSDSGEYGSAEVIYTQTILADSNYYFFVEPIASLAVGDPSAYNITSLKTFGGPNGELTAVTFSVEYTYPNQNVSGDLIRIKADAIQIINIVPLVSGFTFDGIFGFSQPTVATAGDNQTLVLTGDPGAVFSVSFFEDAGSGTETVYATNVTMPASGNYTIPNVIFPSFSAGTPPYQVQISGDINTSITNVGNESHIDFNQYEQLSLTVSASTSNIDLSITGSPSFTTLLPNNTYVPGTAIDFEFKVFGDNMILTSSPDANSFSPVIPDPADPDFIYSLNSITTTLVPENLPELEHYSIAGQVLVDGTTAISKTHDLNIDNHITTVVLPSVTTTAVSNIASTSADSGGESITDGNGTIFFKGIQWSEFADFNTILGANDEGTGTADFNSTITGLTTGNTYYVRAYAVNEAGTAYGQVESFQTSGLPALTTAQVVNVSWDSADGGGKDLSDNSSPITAKGIQWSTSSNFTTIEGSTNDGTGTQNFNSSLTGLTETTTYYVRAYATNAVGTGYGQTVSFQTAALPVTGLAWTTTVNNPCSSAPWTISNNNTKIRYDIVDSDNCGGSCTDTQAGTATATITVGASDVDMGLDFEGIGELMAANFEKISFELDGVEVARANAAGGGQPCAMGPVVKTFITPPPYRLNANTSYTFFIDFTTNDELYHVGAFYEVDLSFANVLE